MTNFTYNVQAVRGAQNGRPFYQIVVPFRVLASMLKLDDCLDVNERSQRLVDKTRAKKVTKYLDKNKDGFYVIPPLVGVIENDDFNFTPVPLDGFCNIGELEISLESKFILFDGQHRAVGIREAMRLAPELGQEFVSITIFAGMTLSDRKQAFHDINYTQKTPAQALCIAYNERDQFDRMLNEVLSNSSLRAFIEYEKNVASGKNEKVYSLKAMKDFAVNLLGKPNQIKDFDEAAHKLEVFIEAIFTAVNLSGYIATLELKHKYAASTKLREESILGHGVTLKAFGLLGNFIINNHNGPMATALEGIYKDTEEVIPKSLFYRGNNWIGRCENDQGKMVNNQLAMRLTYYKLKQVCGLELTPQEMVEEKTHLHEVKVEEIS